MPAVTLGIWIIKILAMTHPKAGELGDGRADIRQFGTWRVGVRGGLLSVWPCILDRLWRVILVILF